MVDQVRHRFVNVTPESGQVITTAVAKLWVGIASAETGFDTQIDSLIDAATKYVQTQTGYQLLVRTDDYYLDRFPECGKPIYLPMWPADVTTVKYMATGVLTTMTASEYILSGTDFFPPTISLAYETSAWPEEDREAKSVEIRLVSGYATVGAIPENIITAIKMIVSSWFNNRETVGVTSMSIVPMGAQAILDSIKIGEAYLEL